MTWNNYFDNSATSFPKPPQLEKEISSWILNGGTYGRSGYRKVYETSRKIEGIRDRLAEYYNISGSERVIFTPGASWSLNMVIKSVIKDGDHVLISPLEHNSVVRPLEELKKKINIEIGIFDSYDDGRIKVSNVKNLIKKNTTLIIISHTSNVNGVIQPLNEIKAECGKIPILIDGAQSGKEHGINMDDFDFMAVSGHKTLLGFPGIGLLLLGKNAQLDSYIQGGTGPKSESFIHPDFLPDKFETGTPNIPGILSLGAGLDYLMSNSDPSKEITKKIINEIKGFNKIKIYSSLEEETQGSAFSFNFEGKDPGVMAMNLFDEYEIQVRSGLHCSPLAHKFLGTISQGGTVRISPGIFHRNEDAERLVEILKGINDE